MKRLLLLRFAPILMLLVSFCAQSNIVFITNIENNNLKLSRAELSLMYQGKQLFFPNGQAIQLIELEEKSTIKAHTYKHLIGLTPSQVQMRRAKSLYSGKMPFPREFSTSKQVIEWVKTHKNSIGYIDLKDLTPSVHVIFGTKSETDSLDQVNFDFENPPQKENNQFEKPTKKSLSTEKHASLLDKYLQIDLSDVEQTITEFSNLCNQTNDCYFASIEKDPPQDQT